MKKTCLTLFAILLASGTNAAERIVSTAGYASEIVALLGQGNKLVGVDTTSILPVEVMQDKAKVGYRRQLSAEGILALNPDLILLAADAAPANAVSQIRDSGVTLLALNDPYTLEDIRRTIATIGKTIGAETQAEALIARLQADEAAFAREKHGRGSALVLLNTGSRGIHALGKDSAGDALLKILGLENAADFTGNKSMTPEAFIGTTADTLLIAARGDATTAPVITKIAAGDPQYPNIAPTAAAQRDCAFAVNILAALGFGANTARDAGEIARTIAPCLKQDG